MSKPLWQLPAEELAGRYRKRMLSAEARVKELEAKVKCLEASTRFSAEDFPRALCNHTAHQIALTEEMAGRVKDA